jgi:hypothetical protein
MPYRVLADAVALLHLAFVLFVAVGGLLALRWPRLAWLHVPCAVWGAIIAFTDAICPLTPLEKTLRQWSGEVGYSGGFIRHYLVVPLFPDGPPAWLRMGLIAAWLLVTGWAYWKLARSRRASRSSPAPDAAVPPRRA